MNTLSIKVSLSNSELQTLRSLLSAHIKEGQSKPTTPNQDKILKAQAKLLRKLSSAHEELTHGDF